MAKRVGEMNPSQEYYKRETASVNLDNTLKRIKDVFSIKYQYFINDRPFPVKRFHEIVLDLSQGGDWRTLKDERGYAIGFLKKSVEYTIIYKNGEYHITEDSHAG